MRWSSKPTFSATATIRSHACCGRRRERSRLAGSADGARGERPMARRVSGASALGRYRYTVTAWIDHFASVASRFRTPGRRRRTSPLPRWSEANSSPRRRIVRRAPMRKRLRAWGKQLIEAKRHAGDAAHRARRGACARSRSATPTGASPRYTQGTGRRRRSGRARASRAWYELFPALDERRTGRATARFATVEARLPYVARAGLRRVSTCPPIHPIGREHRKGRNNALDARARRPRQPVGDRLRPRAATRRSIRSSGTLDDFRALRRTAREHGHRGRARHRVPVLARPSRGCSEHPEWFRRRPDGTVKYAENPPKKYQDIYPFNFESRRLAGAVGRAEERLRVLDRRRACTIFRVDNPHTKPFAFWEWVIGEVEARAPGRDLPRPRRSRARR